MRETESQPMTDEQKAALDAHLGDKSKPPSTRVEFRKGEVFALKGCLFQVEHGEGERIVMRFVGTAPSRAELRRAQRNARKKKAHK
jgi:hypothetical protein